MDPSTVKTEPTTPVVHMPDEQVFNSLKVILNDFNQSVNYLKSTETITPCETQTIIEVELYKTIPTFMQILLDGLTLNKTAEATSSTTMSLSNTTVNFDKIDQNINEIKKQLEASYQILLQKLDKTSFQKRCQDSLADSTNDKTVFLNDLSGIQSPLEYYSIYTEFISYIYSFYVSIKSILATLFNKTSLLVDNSTNVNNRSTNTKKSKKKANEVQSPNVVSENENEVKLWDQLQNLESIFNQQLTNITENIQKYESFIRIQGKIEKDEYDRLEKDLGGNTEQSNK